MSKAMDIIRAGRKLGMDTDHESLSNLVALGMEVEDTSTLGNTVRKQRRKLAAAINPSTE